MSYTHSSEREFYIHAHPYHDDPHMHIPPSDQETYETANQHHYDATAHQYNDRPDARTVAEHIGQAMIDTGLLKEGITTVMDFACGTGLISRELAAKDPKSIVGVDISQGMVDQYNKIVFDHGIPPEEMRAICVPPYEKLQGMTFDVIVVSDPSREFEMGNPYRAQCASAYHHFASIDEVTTLLVSTYLNPGGSLLVADFARGELAHEIFPENSRHIVAHKGGFTEQDIRSTFEKAGLQNITFEIIGQGRHDGHAVSLFLARGDKQIS